MFLFEFLSFLSAGAEWLVAWGACTTASACGGGCPGGVESVGV